MTKTKGPRRSATARRSPKRPAERQLVLLDQGPLRRQAATACSRAMARLEKAKLEWKRFQVEDKAAFARWMAATFGALLSRLREVDAAVQDRERLVREIEAEVMFGGARSYRAAYGRVRERRSQPVEEDAGEAPPPPRSEQGPGGGRFEDLSESDAEAIFYDFLQNGLGVNPDRMDDATYQEMFRTFQENVLGQEPPPPPPPVAAPPRSASSRVKELYRILVRRLHPDTRADDDVEVSALWHEVQAAYGEENVERLEMLLALTDLQANATGEHTSLSQLRSVLAELRRSLQALQRNLGAARRDPAWNFGRNTDRVRLKARLGRGLESRLCAQESLLAHLDATLADWSKAPRARRKQTRQRQPDFFY